MNTDTHTHTLTPIFKKKKYLNRHSNIFLFKDDVKWHKRIQKHLIAFVTVELQIKAVRYQYIFRIAKIPKIGNINCWQGFGATGTLIHCWWECKMVHPLGKSLTVSYEAKCSLTIQSSICALWCLFN